MVSPSQQNCESRPMPSSSLQHSSFRAPQVPLYSAISVSEADGLSLVSTRAEVAVATKLIQPVPTPWPGAPKRQEKAGSSGFVESVERSMSTALPHEAEIALVHSSPG